MTSLERRQTKQKQQNQLKKKKKKITTKKVEYNTKILFIFVMRKWLFFFPRFKKKILDGSGEGGTGSSGFLPSRVYDWVTGDQPSSRSWITGRKKEKRMCIYYKINWLVEENYVFV